MTATLRDLFLGAIVPARQPFFAPLASLDDALDRAQTEVVMRYPELALDEGWLVDALVRRADELTELDALHVADAYLADRCAAGDAKALAVFQREYGSELDRAIHKSPTLGLTKDEFRQLAFERLFVSAGDTMPRIGSYRARGALRSWLRVMASRLVVDLSRRQDKTTHTNDELAKRIGVTGDGELSYLRQAYGAALSPAFEHALAQLTVRQRNLLRQRFLHGMTAERLATVYDVHRSTIFDWLGRARVDLLAQVRAHLAETIPGQDLDSVVNLLGSRLNLSVRRMLQSRLEDDADHDL